MGMDSEERARRIYESSEREWCRFVTDIMSDKYMIYHWSMPVLLVVELTVLLFLAIWPLWCGVLAFVAALALFDGLNELVAYLAWRRYDRLSRKKQTR